MMHIEQFILPHYSKKHLGVETSSWVTKDQTRKYLDVPGANITQAGQDSSLVKTNIDNNPNECLVGVADGHGSLGHHHSFVAIRVLANKFLQNKETIRYYLQEAKSLCVEKLVTSLYHETQAILKNKQLFPTLQNHSGTTMSMSLVLMVNNKRYIVTSNVGDSPVLLSERYDCCNELSMDQSCDNPKAVERYLARLAKAKETCDPIDQEKYNPKPVYYGRINCPEGYSIPSICDDEGKPCPLSVYKYVDNKPVFDTENYEKICQVSPCGFQSIRTPPIYIGEDGIQRVVQGREMENWGSTLEGTCQSLSSFGDFNYAPDIDCDPYVRVDMINNYTQLLLATDGLTDLFHYDILMNWFWDNNETGDFNEFLFQNADQYQNQGYIYKVENQNKYPLWDDVSGIFIKLDCVKKEIPLHELGKKFLLLALQN